jgi:SAM-dependent methyltransferase
VNPNFGDAELGGYHGYLDYLADREQIEAKFADILRHVEAEVDPGALLDVGAGPGFMVSVGRARGWEASGIDLNRWAVDFARDRVGVDVREGSLPDPQIEAGRYDGVTMMDLLEHVPDPAALIAEAARILRPGGIIAVLTPDAGSPVSRALGRRWPEVIRVPEHLVLFSIGGLAALLRGRGFDPIGWHSVGKTSSVQTLLADVTPIAPRLFSRLERASSETWLARRTFELDPHTKFCIYARLTGTDGGATKADPTRRPPRLAKRRRTRRRAQRTFENDSSRGFRSLSSSSQRML